MSKSRSRAYKSWIPNARHVLLPRRTLAPQGHRGAPRIQRRPEPSPPSTPTVPSPVRLEATNSPTPKQPTSRRVLADHPRLQVAWDALQELYGLYLAEDYDGALAALRRFADLYATGQLPEFRKVVDTVIAWGDEILAWPDDHPTADSKEPTTSSKSSAELPTASPTRIITQPEDSS